MLTRETVAKELYLRRWERVGAPRTESESMWAGRRSGDDPDAQACFQDADAVLALVQPALAELRAAQEEIREYEDIAALQRQREAPWIALWQRETGKGPLVYPDYGKFLEWLVERLRNADALKEVQK